MCMNNVVWDYAGMQKCAAELEKLRDRANTNKGVLDKTFDALTAAMNADTGKALMAAYQKNVSSIQLFAQVLDAEAKQLRGNVTYMQQSDAEIAAQVRRKFKV